MDFEDLIIKCLLILVVFLMMAVFIGAPIMVMCSCSNDAKIINAKFGTNYSAWDMFTSGRTIKKTLIGEKQNLNVEMK